MEKKITKGRITVPTDAEFLKETIEIMGKWGADAVRDCDGTVLPKEIADFSDKVYSTYFVTRGDNEWARANLDERQHFFLMSKFVTAQSNELSIDIMDGYFDEQVAPDYDNDPHKYWEVIDRTTGEILEKWSADTTKNTVTFKAAAYHRYTVSFLAYTNWDSTQMYNYITNDWTRDKEISYDPRYPKTRKYVVERLKQWMDNHPDTTVVRFTTFVYHFALLFNNRRKEKFVDWFGYGASVSPRALDEFEIKYGYRLRAEDIVDGGYYNSPFRVPSKAFLDYMDFIQQFVCGLAKELVDEVHKKGKEAMMFLGDTWIGAEPYCKYFPSVGLDAVVGSVGGGVTIRMLSEIKGVKYTEGRFLPYFFPDTFYEGGNPTKELNKNWLTARRAILRKPVDRIGYGGYLKLAAKFPDFIDRVGEICDEFRRIYEVVSSAKPFCKLKVALINSWGKLRSWQSHMVAHELWYKQIYSYQGILEALSGMGVDVEFLSFKEVAESGVPKGIDVIINAGDAHTAFSGDKEWLDERLCVNVRKWVADGGGFVGVGEPSAILNGGSYFQMSDILGVERELGLTLSHDKYNVTPVPHFITADNGGAFASGEVINNVYAFEGTKVLAYEKGNVTAAANDYFKGRGVYFSGLPYDMQNSRMLYRALVYASGKENELKKWYTDNVLCECNFYPDQKLACVVNNSGDGQITSFFDGEGREEKLTLKPMEIRWVKY